MSAIGTKRTCHSWYWSLFVIENEFTRFDGKFRQYFCGGFIGTHENKLQGSHCTRRWCCHRRSSHPRTACSGQAASLFREYSPLAQASIKKAGGKLLAAGQKVTSLEGAPFYKGRLQEVFDLDVIVPSAADRRVVHDIIYSELVAGEVLPESRAAYRKIIARLIAQGARAIILGCTEIMLLVSEEDSAVPLFDTTTIHAIAAVDRALAS